MPCVLQGKIGGQQDDVAICMQLVMIAMRTFFESAKYAKFSQQPISSGPLPMNQN